MLVENLMVDKDAFDTLYEAFCLQCAQEALDESEEWEDEGNVSESTYMMEGTNIEAIKLYFSEKKEECKDEIKAGNQTYSSRNFKEARDHYKKGLSLAEDLKKKTMALPNDVGSTFLAWLIEGTTALFTLIGMFDGAIITRKLTSQRNYDDAIDETMSYNQIKAMFVANYNKLIKWCKVRIAQCESAMK